jgi:hypothetical protein
MWTTDFGGKGLTPRERAEKLRPGITSTQEDSMHLRSIAAAALASLSMQAQAADLLGDTLTFTRAYPSADTPWLVWDPVSVSTTVTADASDAIVWSLASSPGNPYQSIDPGAFSVEWTFTRPTGYIGGGADTFDGYVITGFSNDITAASVSANTSGLMIEVNHTARQITIDLSGNNAAPTSFVLSVAVVPEPASAALMAGGLMVLAAMARRSRGRPF